MKLPFATPSPRAAKLLVALFFLGIIVLGMLTTTDYASPWDEGTEMDTLRQNAAEYALHLGLSEVLTLPKVVNLIPLARTSDRDHGVAALYSLIPMVLDSNVDRHEQALILHAYIWLVFTLGAFGLYSICRALGLSRALGCFAVLMLLLSPRFFADGHYNSKDIVFVSLTLLTAWRALRLMQKPTYPAALSFAFFGALACNIRFVGIAVWGLCALFVLITHIVNKTLTRSVAFVGVTSLAALCGFYLLFTPVLWSVPIGDFIRYCFGNALAFSRWGSQVMYMGELYRIKNVSLPWHYLPYLIFATTPMWILLLFFIGLGAFVAGLLRKKLSAAHALPLALLILLCLLPVITAIVTKTRTYNGWRHFYFVYGPLLAVAAYGAAALFKIRAKAFRVVVAVVLIAACLGSGLDMAINHPHEYAYFQPFVRSILQEDWQFMDVDYWNMSVPETLKALADELGEEEEITIAALNYTSQANLQSHLVSMPQDLASRFTLVDVLEMPHYRIANPVEELTKGFAHSETMVELLWIEAYGIPVMFIYEDLATW